MHRRLLMLLALTGTVAALLLGLLAPWRSPQPPRGRLTASSYDIDTTDRGAVERAFRTRWLPAVATGPSWSGSVPGCRKGAISSTYLARLGTALNFARALNRTDPVVLRADRYSTSSSYSTQATALIMRANGALSHDPPPSWTCYSKAGASGAAHSSLMLVGSGLTAGQTLAGYLFDSGPNVAVGHRRWLTSPWAGHAYAGATSNTNALMVVLASTSSGRRNPAFTSWPSQGWFPLQLEPAGRWSWSSRESRADLSDARVRVWRDGTALTVRRYAVQAGYAQPTLVWQLPSGAHGAGSYQVTVSGVRSASGTLRPAISYRVRIFRAQT